ncbi:UNVERIFIED_ORG: CRISPR-associated endonuclease Cas2 [Clostridium botulinum]|uniref:CRISPR-associated endoribonuclease Cas2 n=1 Tax=Clostridium botulinum TaxID=1491 RepID=A0A6B4JSQ5_CLOBO|nr:CRISPR-associated endonuclease Cas2 [Clostridium botulinum]EES47852.1 CRISPR-associated protein Cas2 [Clostridium botulinum E1 str. 'BoNT E Beluga']MBN1058772.1 CRISPR-associated endonuclease Cas2 [Clostridium botulinum]MBN1061942.1 CRISPR-associated endonuclease Cas2 [Clostridium botulinum]MBY6762915.1 CRISPR-associated endonuclease Cas2 [Clostridium botulinum]MBY6921750.1 CRISPR-associated endonuclease Cas2 [Clostridium botulinum]
MFVIVTYDVGEKRVNKVRKKLKMYLTWTQNSVFEGEITNAKLKKCLSELSLILDKEGDSLYIYKVKNNNNIEKNVVGELKSYDNMFL